MITFSLIIILAVIYIVLKILNTRARFEQEDAERAAREAEAMEIEAEEAEIRSEAIDVEEVETITDADSE